MADLDAMENFRAIHDLWFSLSVDQRIEFIETNIRIQNNKGVFSDLIFSNFQIKWFLDGPLFNDFTKVTNWYNRIGLKSRNAGASYIMIAVEATITAWVYPNVFIPVIANIEDRAQDIIKFCKKTIEHSKFEMPLLVPLKDQTMFSVRFANGSEIKAFAGGNPDGIRGPRALIVYADEFAFIPKSQEILSAIQYFVAEGGMISILSTPWGRQNTFWKILEDRENYSENGWHRHYMPLFIDGNLDVTKPIPPQLDAGKIKLNIPWINIDFIEKKRMEDAPFNYANFLQETAGIPMDEVSSAITQEVLDTKRMDSYALDARPRLDSNGEYDMSRIFCMSVDYGGERNMTAVTMWEALNGMLVTCYTERFRGNFNDQKGALLNLASRFLPNYFIGDATGMGGKNWMDHMHTILKDCVVLDLNYSKKDFALEAGLDMNNKNFMVVTSIRNMSMGHICVPRNHLRLREELLGLRKLVYEKTIKYTGKDGPAGADDLAMSGLQAMMIFDLVFGGGSIEVAGSIDNNRGLSRATPESNRKPMFRKVESIEAAGFAHKKIERDIGIVGFSKLI